MCGDGIVFDVAFLLNARHSLEIYFVASPVLDNNAITYLTALINTLITFVWQERGRSGYVSVTHSCCARYAKS